MNLIKKIISKGIINLDRNSTDFENEYETTTQEIEKTRKEMKEWSRQRKITRNK